VAEPNDNDPPRDRPWDRGGAGRPRDDDDRPRRRRDEDDDDYDDRPRRRGSGAEPSNGLATAGLILGIPSLCLGPLLGVPALICSGIALGRPGGRTAAIAGLVLGGIGTLLTPIMLIGLMLPAVQKVREAAGRTKDSNSMKQIALGMHNFHDVTGKLPPANDENLSWRYHLLPYIEQDNLFRAMNPREPWDGPTNRRFANTQVKTYVSTADPPETVETRYRVFVGPNTLYEPGKKPLAFAEIRDGTANTILFVEARTTVPWAQPKELVYDRNGSLPELGAPSRNGYLVTLADGSVRFMSNKTSPEMLRGAIDPSDGRFFEP
jgi:hypothetical protein